MRPDQDYAAFLFDMDGTLITSIAAAERVWAAWGRRHGLDLDVFMPTIHGVRAVDTIRKQNLPGIDLQAEVDWVTRGEIEDLDGVTEIPGAKAFVAALPSDRWAVVTSASPELATARLRAAGLEPPPVLITAFDVERGKPDPAGFRLAAQRLGVAPADCLVFEDAPAGIGAAEAAGMDVMVITATHSHPVETRHATLADYQAVRCVIRDDGRLSLSL